MKIESNLSNHSERNSLLFRNTVSGLLLQIVTVLCGFILPRAILKIYGSGVNGLVNSITQFLQMIAFAELGMGAVAQSALYKPLAEKDYKKVSEVIAASNAFFKKIGMLLILYVIGLCVYFPNFVDKEHTFAYDVLLIGAISISFFAQYYFGLVDRLFMNAVQHSYVQNNIYTVTLIINTAACYFLIYKGCSIHSVKLLTSLVFLLRPLLVRNYINKNYNIDRKAKFDKDTIKQKWNGVAQHVAAIVLDSTDTIVLSTFSTLINVSIYSVYNIVISGIKQIVTSAFGGVGALLGELWAKGEKKELNSYFEKIEIILHFASTALWLITWCLVTPFVLLYTKGVNDANYDVPLFALIICLASAFYCYRLSYNSLILAVGHYKQTQGIFITAAIINMLTSILFVMKFGLVGVALGTLLSMLYQHIRMQWYCIKKLGVYSYSKAIKQYVLDLCAIIIATVLTNTIKFEVQSWLDWIVKALSDGVIIVLICGLFVVVRQKRKNNVD